MTSILRTVFAAASLALTAVVAAATAPALQPMVQLAMMH